MMLNSLSSAYSELRARYLSPAIEKRLVFSLIILATVACSAALAYRLAAPLSSSPVLIVLFPIALAVFFVVVIRHDLVLLGIIALRATIDPVLEIYKQTNGFGPGAAINAMILLLMFITIVRRPVPLLRGSVLIWLPFLVLAAIAIGDSPDPARGIRMLMLYVSYMSLYAMPIALINNRADARRFVLVLLAASIIPTVGGFFDIARGGLSVADPDDPELDENSDLAVADYGGFRIQGVFSHPNICAMFLVAMATALLYMIKSRLFKWTALQRIALYAYLVMQLALLVATQTRSAWAAAFFVFLVYGVFVERKFLIYMAAALPTMLLWPPIQDRLAEAIFGMQMRANDQMTSYAWRVEMWRAAIPWIQEKWLSGWGLDSYTDYSAIFFLLEYKRAYDAHNLFIQLAFEIGIPGVLAFIAIFFWLIAAALRSFPHARLESVLIAASCVGFLMISYSDNVHRYLVSNWYLFFMLGTLSAITWLPRRTRYRVRTEKPPP